MANPRIALGPIWDRTPDDDIDCPLCLFELGSGKALSYLCRYHPIRPQLIGTHTYWCSVHQREVSPLMYVGVPAIYDVFVRMMP